MTNLSKFTDLSRMLLIFGQECSALVIDNKAYKINADLAFEEWAKKKL